MYCEKNLQIDYSIFFKELPLEIYKNRQFYRNADCSPVFGKVTSHFLQGKQRKSNNLFPEIYFLTYFHSTFPQIPKNYPADNHIPAGCSISS